MSQSKIKDFAINKSDWTKVKFGHVVVEPRESIVDSKEEGIERAVGLEHLDSDEIRLTRFSSVNEGAMFTKKFLKDDVLFGRRRAYLRKASQVLFNGVCSGDITVMRAKNGLLPSLLPFIVNNDKFFDYAITHSAGGLSPRVKFKDLAEYEFFLPPEDQQSNLAELLWDIVSVCQANIALRQQLEVALSTFEYEYFSSKDCDNVNLKDVVIKTLSGGTPDSKKMEFYTEGSIPWITTKILEGDYISEGEKYITHDAIKNSAAKILPKANIVAGTRVGVGKFAINKVDISFSQDVTGLIIDNKKIDITYLIHQLNSSPFQKKIKPLLRGTTIKGVTKDDLLNLAIALPDKVGQEKCKSDIELIKKGILDINLAIKSSYLMQKTIISKVF